VRPIAILSAVLLASCASSPPPRRMFDRRLVLGEPGQPQVVLEADWSYDRGRYCVSRRPVDLLTPAGPVRLHDASLCATPVPAAIVGEAHVPLPAIGLLNGVVVHAMGPRGRLSLARGRQLGALEIGRERLAVEPSHFYLSVDYAGRHVLPLGRASLTMDPARPRLAIDPSGPVFYFAGDLAGILSKPLVGAAFGLSPTGGLLHTTAQPLYDGTTSAPARLAGHLLVQGTFPLGDLPVEVTGRVLVDLDADDDGLSALAGDERDVALAGDAVLRLAVAAGGFRLDAALARASFLRDGEGTLFFSGSAPAALFAATSLSPFEPRSELAVRGVYSSPTDFAVLVRGDGRLVGLPFHEAQVELGSAAVKIAGRVEIAPLGAVAVAGAMGVDGSWALAGRAADLTFAGVPVTDVQLTVTSRGPSVAGTTMFLGRPFRLSGGVGPAGLTLTGAVALSSTSRVLLTLDGRGPRAAFEGRVCASRVCIDVPPTELDSSGNVCQSFPVVGRQCVKVM
jgi:hypothetical protein